MNARQHLHDLWLKAQGVPEMWIIDRSWKRPGMFRSIPERCLLCGREWRPDRPLFVAILGKVLELLDGDQFYGLVWYSPQLDIVQRTGSAMDHIRYLCREHLDEYDEATDCFTGESVLMVKRKGWLARLLDSTWYWTRSTARFVSYMPRFVFLWFIVGRKAHR